MREGGNTMRAILEKWRRSVRERGGKVERCKMCGEVRGSESESVFKVKLRRGEGSPAEWGRRTKTTGSRARFQCHPHLISHPSSLLPPPFASGGAQHARAWLSPFLSLSILSAFRRLNVIAQISIWFVLGGDETSEKSSLLYFDCFSVIDLLLRLIKTCSNLISCQYKDINNLICWVFVIELQVSK